MISMIGSRLTDEILYRSRPLRVLIFNCTSGRSGNTFLGAMLAKADEQLKKHGRTEDVATLFDQVIFCANVTYADGGFKGGASPSLTIPHRPTQCESH